MHMRAKGVARYGVAATIATQQISGGAAAISAILARCTPAGGWPGARAGWLAAGVNPIQFQICMMHA